MSKSDPDRSYSMNRRDFLRTAAVAAGSAAVVPTLLSSVGCGANIPSGAFPAGALSGFPLGQATRLAEADVYILHTEQGYAALSAACTHMGCAVKPEGSGFACPCHGATFGADGTVTGGPAESDLGWFAVRLENGNLVVDPTRTVAKGTYVSG